MDVDREEFVASIERLPCGRQWFSARVPCIEILRINAAWIELEFTTREDLITIDANPEAILIGSPLDGTRNPTETKLGDELEDITGIITYAFGFYRILPLTAIKITGSANGAPEPSKLTAGDDCSSLTFGVYNVENLQPSSSHLPRVADHIVNLLNTPTVMFLQEVQDNNGPTNDNGRGSIWGF